MLKVNVDPDKPSGLAALLGPALGLAGIAAAPFTGGASTLATMATLGAAGSALGTLGGGIADSQINKDKDFQGGGVTMGDGIERRLDQQNNSPMQHITDALNVLHTLPAAIQSQVGPALQQGYRAGYEQRRPNLGNYQFDQPNFGGP